MDEGNSKGKRVSYGEACAPGFEVSGLFCICCRPESAGIADCICGCQSKFAALKWTSTHMHQRGLTQVEGSSAQPGALRRLVAITLTVWPVLGLYMYIDRHQVFTPTTVVMPSWVPFWPAFTLPYLGLMLVTWLLPVTIRQPRLFRACLWALGCAYLLTVPWWILTPTTLARPGAVDGWWAGCYSWLAAVDPPNNIMPCGHGVGPAVGAWFAGRDHPKWLWWLGAMIVLGLPSIAFTWQHRPFDILLGLGAGAIGILFGEVVVRRGRLRFADPREALLPIQAKD